MTENQLMCSSPDIRLVGNKPGFCGSWADAGPRSLAGDCRLARDTVLGKHAAAAMDLWQGRGTGDHCEQVDSGNQSPVGFAHGGTTAGKRFRLRDPARASRLDPADAAGAAIRIYQNHGTPGFALFEGEISLVVADPAKSCVYLVVDKFGCGDIYFRRMETQLHLRATVRFSWMERRNGIPCQLLSSSRKLGSSPDPTL